VGLRVEGEHELPDDMGLKLRRQAQYADDSPVEIEGKLHEEQPAEQNVRVYRVPLRKVDRAGEWEIVTTHGEDKEYVVDKTEFWT
jgi:hypothetical protein